MADPVQQAGGGEQIPAPAVDAPSSNTQETAASPQEKLATIEPPASKVVKDEKPVEEVKVDTAQAVLNTIDGSSTPVTIPEAEVSSAPVVNLESPKVSSTPVINAEPDVIKSESEVSSTPAINSESEVLSTPAINSESEVSSTPAINSESEILSTPAINSESEVSSTPVTKSEPEISSTPVINEEPPQVSSTPDINAEPPQVSSPSVISSEPEVSSTPVIDPEPEVTPQEAKDTVKELAANEIKGNEELQNKEEVKIDLVDIAPATSAAETSVKDDMSNGKPKESEDWQKRESELLKKIEELEKVKNARSEDGLRLELKVREEEIDLLKARVRNLETELQAALSKPGGKNHEMIENIKQQHEELLSKARGMIFDKTKMVKNQELQIEALTTQVQSLKDINLITKDLLEIRNSEVKAMEDRFQAMEARFKAEKERYDLVLKRAQTSTNINDDLRKEYETQLAIFKELREKYEQRVQALVAENNRLKEAVKGPGTSG